MEMDLVAYCLNYPERARKAIEEGYKEKLSRCDLERDTKNLCNYLNNLGNCDKDTINNIVQLVSEMTEPKEIRRIKKICESVGIITYKDGFTEFGTLFFKWQESLCIPKYCQSIGIQ